MQQLVMPFASPPSYHAADFIAGEANAAAYGWVERWPDWPYSILLIHGGPGSGKTHLAHIYAQKSGGSFIDPARLGKVPADQILTGGHSWVLDGLADVASEAALAQLINHARARGDYMLITAPSGAHDYPFQLPDLASRIKALPSVSMGAPDDALLAGVLAKTFADLQLRIAPDVLNYAISQLERSYAAAQQFARSVNHLSLARGRAVTIPLVKEVLAA